MEMKIYWCLNTYGSSKPKGYQKSNITKAYNNNINDEITHVDMTTLHCHHPTDYLPVLA